MKPAENFAERRAIQELYKKWIESGKKCLKELDNLNETEKIILDRMVVGNSNTYTKA